MPWRRRKHRSRSGVLPKCRVSSRIYLAYHVHFQPIRERFNDMPNKVYIYFHTNSNNLTDQYINVMHLYDLGLISRNLISTQGRKLTNHATGTTWRSSRAVQEILATEDCAVGILVNIFTFPYKTNKLVQSLESLPMVD